MKKSNSEQSGFIRSFYEKKLRVYQDEQHHTILGWEDHESQYKRFMILLQNVVLECKTLLDFGCGMADLLACMQRHNIPDVTYTGVDISPALIHQAQKLYPGTSFYTVDILEQPHFFLDNSFDILYSSGIFNLKIDDNLSFFKQTFEIFYAITRETIVFNLLSDTSVDKEDTFHYFSKNDIEDFIRSFPLASIEIVDDYLINDFTVICRKEIK